jgi:hypothetical protein
MSKLKALVILNLRAMLNALRFTGRGKKGRAATGIGAMVLLGFFGLYLSSTYSFLLSSQLAPLGMIRLVVLIMPVMVVGMGLMFTVFAAQGIIFGGKDNDIMLALPIPPFNLLLARTLALYLENLVFTFFVMLPAGDGRHGYKKRQGGSRKGHKRKLCAKLSHLSQVALQFSLEDKGGYAPHHHEHQAKTCIKEINGGGKKPLALFGNQSPPGAQCLHIAKLVVTSGADSRQTSDNTLIPPCKKPDYQKKWKRTEH